MSHDCCSCSGLTFTIDRPQPEISFSIERQSEISFSVGDRIVETGDYNKLVHRPSINEVVLVGNKTFEDLGDHNLTNLEIKAIFDRVFNS